MTAKEECLCSEKERHEGNLAGSKRTREKEIKVSEKWEAEE